MNNFNGEILKKISTYECILWDWNGTLLDDAEFAVECINKILPKYETPLLSIQKYRSCFDFPVKQYYKNIGLDLNKFSFEEIRDEYIEIYNELAPANTSLFDSTKELIFEINKIKKQYILSAVSQWNLDLMTRHFGIDHLFIQMIGADNHYASSKLENGIKLIQSFSSSPDQCILIGDTTHDFDVASSLGIDCLLISDGHQSSERLLVKTSNVLSRRKNN